MQDQRRHSLRRRLTYVLTIVCAQAICLGVGLWMHHQFLHSSVRDAAFDLAWTELSDHVIQVAAREVKQNPSLGTDSAGPGSGSAPPATSPSLDESGVVLMVDAEWRVISGSRTSAYGVDGMASGDRISWTPVIGETGDLELPSRGFVTLRGVKFLASTAPSGRSGVTVVALRLVGSIERSAEAVLATLPAISGLTFVWTFALLTISAYMIFSGFYDHAESAKARSVADGLRQRQHLIRTRDSVVFGLAKLADSRDPETGDHLERIAFYSTTLAAAMRHHPKYGREVSPAFIRLIDISSVLHDIGKVGIDDHILLKKGRLTPDEREIMQTHAAIGGDCLREIERRLGNSNFLQMAREIAYAHHERWDGTGYPAGLAGEEIPLPARIVAIADVYDALSSKRVYKEAMPLDECEEIIRDSSGTHFDPDLVEVWSLVAPKFAEIALRFSSAKSSDSQSDQGVPEQALEPQDKGKTKGDRVSTEREPAFAANASGIGASAQDRAGDEDFHKIRRAVGDDV